MRNKKLALALVGIMSLSVLTACGDKVDKSTVKTENEIIVEVDEQKSINTAEDHFEYVQNHQSEVSEEMMELIDLLGEEGEEKLTKEVTNKMSEIKDLATEYIKYDNKIEETDKADEAYKVAMNGLSDWLDKTEKALADESYLTGETGSEELLTFAMGSLQAFTEFQEAGVETNVVDGEGNLKLEIDPDSIEAGDGVEMEIIEKEDNK